MDCELLHRDIDIRRAAQSHRSGYVPPSLPDGVVYASSAEDVVRTLTYASEHCIPVLTRGLALV